MFCYSVAKTIASYVVPLGGFDAIAFTGGIGEKSFIKRAKILGEFSPSTLDCMEIVLKNNVQKQQKAQFLLQIHPHGGQR